MAGLLSPTIVSGAVTICLQVVFLPLLNMVTDCHSLTIIHDTLLRCLQLRSMHDASTHETFSLSCETSDDTTHGTYTYYEIRETLPGGVRIAVVIA